MDLLIPQSFDKTIDFWLSEDNPSINYHAYLTGSTESSATLYCKDSGMVTGLAFFNRVFQRLNCQVTWSIEEGVILNGSSTNKIPVATVKGRVCDILEGERIALNLITHSSSISTHCHKLIKIKEKFNWKGKIAGTRKTLPGMRLLQKMAIISAGGDSHRYDLSTCVMIKDNHIKSIGSIQKAIEKCQKVLSFANKIEVECKNIDEALEAAKYGADIIMLDNYKPENVNKDAKLIKEYSKNTLVEISGGITENNISEYFDENVDIISVGGLTQEINRFDFSLKL